MINKIKLDKAIKELEIEQVDNSLSKIRSLLLEYNLRVAKDEWEILLTSLNGTRIVRKLTKE